MEQIRDMQYLLNSSLVLCTLTGKCVLAQLNVKEPARNWTWDDMIKLIKDCTVKKSSDGMAYYGCGYYNRLDSYYGIAAKQTVQGEFGFDGTQFDLSAWAKGEQQFAELKQGGYIAPQTQTLDMENWMGSADAWCGASSHVALFTEAFWTYQGTWATKAFKKYNLDIVPYVIPAVSKEDDNNNKIITQSQLSTLVVLQHLVNILVKHMSFLN